jgi:hypothetical protein
MSIDQKAPGRKEKKRVDQKYGKQLYDRSSAEKNSD